MSSIKERVSTSSSEGVSVPPPSPRNRGNCYPPSAPGRRAYLAARSLGIVFSLALVFLSVAAFVLPPKQNNWLSPILNVSLPSFFPNLIDIVIICRANKRAHAVQRLVHDGLLAVGISIAFGFIIAFSLPAIKEEVQPSATLGRLIWFCMTSLILVHSGIAVGGLLDTIRLYRSRVETVPV